MKKPLEIQLETTQRDIGLILEDVRSQNFPSAMHGFDTVIHDLEVLRSEMYRALSMRRRDGLASTLKEKGEK